jgi:hypothetical protein
MQRLCRGYAEVMQRLCRGYAEVMYRLCRGCGPGSSVGIATDYGLDGPGIESR